MIVPGGGLSPDGSRWVACRPGFFLPVRVLSRLFRRLFLEGLMALHRAGNLIFFGDLAGLSEADAFAAWIAPLRKTEWVVYAKPPFGGPEAVLAYLSRYTHRVAISNSRLISADAETVAFRWKDYRIKTGDPLPDSGLPANHERGRSVMQLTTDEFIRRVLIHVLPDGFHRIRHYGLRAARPISRRSARCSGQKWPSRMTGQPPRSFRSLFENLAQNAAGQCASSKSSAVARNHTPARCQEGRQHDGTPITPPKLVPETHLVPGRVRFALCQNERARMAPTDSKIRRSISKINYNLFSPRQLAIGHPRR